MSYDKYVTVVDKFWRTKWMRKVGDGDWTEMDLTPYNGVSPVAFIDSSAEWVESTTLVHPESMK